MEWLILVAVIAVIAVVAVLYGKQSPAKPGYSHLPEQFVVFDLKTTGPDPYTHEIIEIGAIRAHRDSDRHDALQSVVKRFEKVPTEITKLTGITQEIMDAEGEPLEKVMQEFIDFIGDLRLVSYDAGCSMAFLFRAAARTGHHIDNPVSYVSEMVQRAYPGQKSFRLEDLTKHLNLPGKHSRRAIADCERAAVAYASAAARLKTVE